MAKAYIHVEWAACGLPAGPPKPSFETRSAHGMALINKVVTLESFLVPAVVPPTTGPFVTERMPNSVLQAAYMYGESLYTCRVGSPRAARGPSETQFRDPFRPRYGPSARGNYGL